MKVWFSNIILMTCGHVDPSQLLIRVTSKTWLKEPFQRITSAILDYYRVTRKHVRCAAYKKINKEKYGNATDFHGIIHIKMTIYNTILSIVIILPQEVQILQHSGNMTQQSKHDQHHQLMSISILLSSKSNGWKSCWKSTPATLLHWNCLEIFFFFSFFCVVISFACVLVSNWLSLTVYLVVTSNSLIPHVHFGWKMARESFL